MRICIFGAASNSIDPAYISTVEDLGRKLAKKGYGMVYGGGAQGLMGAAARGFHEENGSIVGVAPKFFDEGEILYKHCEKFIYTETMRERKQIMEDNADAFIIVPGGIGTFEEFFEIFTLKQLDRHQKPIVIFNINGYYDSMLAFLENTIKQGFMKEANRELFSVIDNCDDILDYIENYKPHHTKLEDLKEIKPREYQTK